MLSKATLKKISIFFIPVPLILAQVFFLAQQNIQKNLDNILERNIQVADQILFHIETENKTALIDPTRCEALQQNLMFERNIDEMLIVHGDNIICSSKLGSISKPLDSYLKQYGTDTLSFARIHGYPEQVLTLTTQSTENPDYRAITIVDRDYFGATIGYKNDLRLKRSALYVGEGVAPLGSLKQGDNPIAIAHSKIFDYEALLEASNVYIEQKELSYFISAIPLLLIFYLTIYIVTKFVDPQRSLLVDLKKAIKRKELALYYQPQIDAITGELKGCEALLRWKHKSRGFVSPDKFIVAAEQNGLANDITDYVLDKALKDFSDSHYSKPFHLGVNVPPDYLSDAHVIHKIERIHKKLKQNNVFLGIEITERQLIDENTQKYISALRVHGIEVLIDDFGTGQTSLAALQHMRVDYLKIDKCFVDTIGIESVNAPVLNAIVRFANELEIKLIAEGVETEAQVKHLIDLGVDFHQGYFYSKPVPFKQLLLNYQ